MHQRLRWTQFHIHLHHSSPRSPLLPVLNQCIRSSSLLLFNIDTVQQKKEPVLLTALDKLEYGLAQARYAIRSAYQAAKNGSTLVETDEFEPRGDVYKNAAAFRQ